ncbi:hypothetical protein BDV93DRAFT_562738 [Ceratobasidium sp. AG-I]|nr:hypothetical protein BDV93DRAFT_562738 [Ceratobasidium sp. AG-I]
MSTILDSFVESLEGPGKSPGSYLHQLEPVDEAEPAWPIVKHTTEDQDLIALQSWLNTARTGLLKLQNISLEQVQALEIKLQKAGYKVRHVHIIAVFRMTTPLHNAPATWLTLCVPEVELAVQDSARCGKPFLLVHGDGRVDIAGGKSRLQPDNRIDVNVRFRHGDKEDRYCVPQPRVILETAFSQSLKNAQEKAWEYLCTGDSHTHAVIIVDMTYPVTQEKNFIAKIAVWSRSDTGKTDEDYPFEASEGYRHKLQAMPEDEQGEESPEVTDGLSPVGSGTLTQASEGTTRVEITPGMISKKAPDGTVRAIETPGYIVVLDETKEVHRDNPHPDGFALVLDIFHFLRRCPQHPNDIPRPSEVALPLDPLKYHLIEALARHRDEHWPRKRKAEPEEDDAAQPLLQRKEGPATTRSTTPPMLRGWVQQKKSKRMT